MLKCFRMKRFVFTIILILATQISTFANVKNVDLDSMIQIGLKQNCDLKIKRMELKAAEKDIKIANRLQNPQIQSYDFLRGMYDDGYFPNFLVDKCKAIFFECVPTH